MKKNPISFEKNKTCCVCDDPGLVTVIELPRLPLTGIYLEPGDETTFDNVDQALLLCPRCGHAQLWNVLDPEFVYGYTYTHRSSMSASAVAGNHFFLEFLNKVAPKDRFRCVVEVGCNDLYLLKKLEKRADRLYGIDPVLDPDSCPSGSPIRTIGKFIEEVDYRSEIGERPDLIISSHAFEHLGSPKIEVERLVENAAENALFVLEVPAFDTLLARARLDHVFHQHLQYFSLASLSRLFASAGCEYVSHTFNQTYWGGTILMAFRKSRSEKRVCPAFAMPREATVRRAHTLFMKQMELAMHTVESYAGVPCYGYGAAQMVPILAYHLHSDLSFMESILDDDPRRAGLKYPNLPVSILTPNVHTVDGALVVVMAIDNMRPILRKLLGFSPLHILTLLNGF